MTWKIDGVNFKDKMNPPEPGSIWDGIIDYDRKVTFINDCSSIFDEVRFFGYDSDRHLQINIFFKFGEFGWHENEQKLTALADSLSRFGQVTPYKDNGIIELSTTHDNVATVLDRISQTDPSLDVNAKKAIVDEVIFPRLTIEALFSELSVEKRWAAVALNVHIRKIFSERIAQGRGDKLLDIMGDYPFVPETHVNPVIASIAGIVNAAAKEGLEKFNKTLGLSSAQCKQFHFFSPQTPHPFFKKLQDLIDSRNANKNGVAKSFK